MSFMNDEEGPHFFDTNILIYAIDNTAGEKHDTALGMVRRLQKAQGTSISIQVMQEFHVIATQKIKKPISIEESLALLADFRHWRCFSPTYKDVLAAVKIQQQFRLSYWDAMIVHSAIASRCRVLYSEDLCHGQRIEGIKIVNPFLILD